MAAVTGSWFDLIFDAKCLRINVPGLGGMIARAESAGRLSAEQISG
jgi:hypothetical protein